MNLMDIEKELEKIYVRNKKVESDKAWEVSWTRRLFIAIVTYIFALVWLIMIHEQVAYLKAIVPVAGFILSTLSIGLVKQWWMRRRG